MPLSTLARAMPARRPVNRLQVLDLGLTSLCKPRRTLIGFCRKSHANQRISITCCGGLSRRPATCSMS
eukprot:5278998-Karenia_brevis.AAC.1